MTKMTLMVIIDSFPLENLVKLVITALVSCANSFRSLTTQLETQRFEEKNNEWEDVCGHLSWERCCFSILMEEKKELWAAVLSFCWFNKRRNNSVSPVVGVTVVVCLTLLFTSGDDHHHERAQKFQCPVHCPLTVRSSLELFQLHKTEKDQMERWLEARATQQDVNIHRDLANKVRNWGSSNEVYMTQEQRSIEKSLKYETSGDDERICYSRENFEPSYSFKYLESREKKCHAVIRDSWYCNHSNILHLSHWRWSHEWRFLKYRWCWWSS